MRLIKIRDKDFEVLCSMRDGDEPLWSVVSRLIELKNQGESRKTKKKKEHNQNNVTLGNIR